MATMEYGSDGTRDILLFGDDPVLLAEVADAATSAGLSIRSEAAIARAIDTLDARAGRLPIVALADRISEPLVMLLARLEPGDIAILDHPLIDLGWTLAPHATLLCDPRPADLVAALAGVGESTTAPQLREEATPSLRHLSEEVGRIARVLAELSSQPIAHAPTGHHADVPPTADRIRTILRARRLRDRFFDAGLFADPAWDMLLDLMAARIEGAQVAVSSLCIAAAVPTTTALRWIKVLTDGGLLVRVADPADGRRSFVALADAVAEALAAYFAESDRQGLTPN